MISKTFGWTRSIYKNGESHTYAGVKQRRHFILVLDIYRISKQERGLVPLSPFGYDFHPFRSQAICKA